MSRGRETDGFSIIPNIEQGVTASKELSSRYGRDGEFAGLAELKKVPSESDALRKLEDLQLEIMAGSINSHMFIALAIQEIGPLIGASGPLTPEIGDAAYLVTVAIRENESGFDEVPRF